MSDQNLASCWISGKEAHAVCQFCGRFVNKEYAQTLPFIMSMFVGANNTPKALVVSGAIWCGTCNVKEEPVQIPELY